MKQLALSQFNHMGLIITGFFIFFTVFMLIVFRTFRKKDKKHYEEMANLPLTEGGDK